MKKFFILLSVILCTVFVGCSKDSDNSNSSNSAIVGTWVGSSYYEEITYSFQADGSFVASYYQQGWGGSEHDYGKYTYNSPNLTLRYDGSNESVTVRAVISGDTLTLSQDGMTIKFYRQ